MDNIQYVFLHRTFPASFFFFRVFQYSLYYNWQKVSKIADDWIRTADLWLWKRLLHQLRHNHCPTWLKMFKLRKILLLPQREKRGSVEYESTRFGHFLIKNNYLNGFPNCKWRTFCAVWSDWATFKSCTWTIFLQKKPKYFCQPFGLFWKFTILS